MAPEIPKPSCLLATSMRNEGAFVVDWVAWHAALGFDLLAASNNCTDHSGALLDRLAELGWLTHVKHDPPADVPPKSRAMKLLHAHPKMAQADWVLLTDVDEFVVLHSANETIQDYLGALSTDALGIALHWKCFGTNGCDKFEDIPVFERFTTGLPPKSPQNAVFKSLFRKPEWFTKLWDHGPRNYTGPGVWGKGGLHWVNGNGSRISYNQTGPYRAATKPQMIAHRDIQLNHYILRSAEEYAAKRGTPSASRHNDRYTDAFFDTYQSGEHEDTSAMGANPRFWDLRETLMSDPDVFRLHHLGCAARVKHLCRVSGADAKEDARWQHHKAKARDGNTAAAS